MPDDHDSPEYVIWGKMAIALEYALYGNRDHYFPDFSWATGDAFARAAAQRLIVYLTRG